MLSKNFDIWEGLKSLTRLSIVSSKEINSFFIFSFVSNMLLTSLYLIIIKQFEYKISIYCSSFSFSFVRVFCIFNAFFFWGSERFSDYIIFGNSNLQQHSFKQMVIKMQLLLLSFIWGVIGVLFIVFVSRVDVLWLRCSIQNVLHMNR